MRARQGGERPFAPTAPTSPLPSHHRLAAEGEHGEKRAGGVEGPDGRAGQGRKELQTANQKLQLDRH